MTPQPDSNLPTWHRSLLLFLHGMPITLWWLKSLVELADGVSKSVISGLWSFGFPPTDQCQGPRMCTMDDDIWLLSFRKKLWPPGMEEWQAYWDATQWASQQKAWARTRLFFGLYSILNICILRSCLSHIPTYLYSIEIWHVHRIIYIYTYTHMHVWIRTSIECMQIYTTPVQIQGNMFCIFQLTTTAAELDKPAKCVAVRDPTCSWGNNHDKQSQYNDRYQ